MRCVFWGQVKKHWAFVFDHIGAVEGISGMWFMGQQFTEDEAADLRQQWQDRYCCPLETGYTYTEGVDTCTANWLYYGTLTAYPQQNFLRDFVPVNRAD